MATEVVHVVDPDAGSGYDYDSLSDWEAGEQGDLTGARDEIAVAKCRCTNGTADTSPTIEGWTTSATQYIKIWTDPSESYRHNGTFQEGNKYRINGVLSIHQNHTRTEGIQIIFSSSSASYASAMYAGTTDGNIYYFDKIICKGVLSGTTANTYGMRLVYQASGTRYVYFTNSIFIGWKNGSTSTIYGYYNHLGWTSYVYNCNFCGCYIGLGRVNGSVTAKNCLAVACDDGFNGSITTSYCATDLAESLSGTGDRNSQTFSFVDSDNGDFHLQSDDTGALGFGLNLYNDAVYPFQDDIDGEDRGGSGASWDIGADEYVAAGTTYQDTATDGFKGSESLARISTFLKSITDGAKASDLAANVATVQGLAADGLISTDEAIALIGLLIQHSFRFRQDDGDEDAASWLATLNANINIAAGAAFRLRYLVDSSGDPSSKQFQIEYRRKPSGGEFGAWKKIN